ncbi:2-hydroxyacyl-CoA dehydratase subunit D [Chloroflexota bacterium]
MNEFMAPALNITSATQMLVARHILKGRRANERGKVAWVTSGAPAEILKALDFYIFYPENHAAICGKSLAFEEISIQAENAGYSRDLCSYARTDIGAALSGLTPVKKLPKPDLLMACTNICQTVLHWYRVLAHHFKAPLILIDTPFIYSEETQHALAFIKSQIEQAIPQAERVAGCSLDEQKLKEITHLSKTAMSLWGEILDRGRHRPAPLSAFDQFIQMAPIVQLRGEAATVDLYAEMLAEVDERITQNISAVKGEKKRLLWDNLPIWFRLDELARFLGRRGVVLAASTYTNAWAELAPLVDPDRPLESAARVYLHPLLNRSSGHKLETMKRMVADFQLDGAIMHSDRSCKPYSIGQMDQRNRLIEDAGVPALLLEADHNDPRAYAEEQVTTRLVAFLEVLGI